MNTVEIDRTATVVKKRGPKPGFKKVGVRATKDDFIPMPDGPKKVRERHASQGAVLDLPKWLMDVLHGSGIDVMWIATSVRGDEQLTRTQVQGFRQGGGWEPVTTNMFPYRGKPIFQGMFYPVDYQGQIEVGGQVMHWRPLELTQQALKEMAREAAAPLEATRKKMRDGVIDGTTSAVTTATAAANAWRSMEETIEAPNAIPMPD